MKTRIIVDSTADLVPEIKKRVHIVPLTVRFGEEEYLDGVTIDHNTFYEKLIECDTLPTTSQGTPDAFMKEFEKAKESGEAAVVITLASNFSGTYQSAIIAASEYKDVYVVDSTSAAMGSGILVELALRLLDEGKTAKEIAKILEEEKKKIVVVALVDTLEYLKKGGRISAAVAFAGTLLSLKPIISVDGGEVKVVGKAMGAKNAKAAVNKLAAETAGVDTDKPFTVLYSGTDRSAAERFAAEKTVFGDNPPINNLGGTIGTHIGPGALGVAFFEK